MSSQRSKPWSQTTLGKSLPIRYGKARTDKAGVVREDSPVYGSSGVIDKFDRALTNGPALIIGRKGTVGATHYSSEPCWPIDTVYFAEPSEGKDLRFFKHLLDHLQLGRMDRSTAVPGLSRDDYNAREVAIPEIDEQRRIVAEIEKQFTRLEAGVSALRRVQANLKRYRAAVLKAACEGRLVPTEAELAKIGNLKGKFEAGETLLARILSERRRNWEGRAKYKEPVAPEPLADVELPEGWVWTGFEQLADGTKNAIKAGPFGSSLKKSFYTPSGFKIYGQEQVIKGNAYFGDYFISRELFEQLQSCEVKPGDILISLVGTTGKVLILPDDCAAGIINPRLLKLSLNRADVNPKFIKILLESTTTRAFFKLAAHGGTMEILNLGILKTLPIALPPLGEQTRIVAEVERRLSMVEELETVVSVNLQRSTRLRQSILQKAFTGTL
jgi:type I restriction enzyme S subunit